MNRYSLHGPADITGGDNTCDGDKYSQKPDHDSPRSDVDLVDESFKERTHRLRNESCTDDDDNEVQEPSCGWGSVRPPWCERLGDIRMYLVVITMCGAVQGMAINGFVNTVISTIERRFEISSTESGLIASCYDIMFVVLVVPISYFGGQGNKPRYLGWGLFTLGIGSFVFSLPHFVSGPYEVGGAKETVCAIGGNMTDRCENTLSSSLSNYKYFFFAGQLLHGAGATALYTLGVTYMDENVPQRKSSFYNGIFYTGAIIGPAIGFMAGSSLLDIYTDIGVDPASLGLDNHNPRWVGAWWIGFLVSGTLAVMLAIPLLAFPPSLPGHQKYALERGQETQAQKASHKTGVTRGLGDILMSVKLLLTNWPFMCLNLAAAADSLLVAGFSTFMPKYLEYQFGVGASTAAFYVGLVVVPCGGGATFVGGLLVKHFDLRIRGILRLCVVASVLLTVSSLSLLITCRTAPFAGVSLPYGEGYTTGKNYPIEKNLDDPCNTGCGCVEEDYFPMCGADGVLYFSPCYAGCVDILPGDGTKSYTNCSCVTTNHSSPLISEGTFGKCDKPCDWLLIFMVLWGVQIVLIFITAMPSLTATLRCVPDHQRDFGLGIQWIVTRCLGSIPGPILFGKMFDLVCVVWQKRCDGDGSCFFYDNNSLSVNLIIMAGVFSVIAAGCFFAAAFFYKVAPKTNAEDIVVAEDIAVAMASQNTVSTVADTVDISFDDL